MLTTRALILLLFILPGIFREELLLSQSPDYVSIFGVNWTKAEAFQRENRHWMEPVLVKNRIPYEVAMAVVFPELVRYSAIRDKMEITLLKALYVNLGEEYANFSIGQFQIKPSFAAMIRETAPMYPGIGISFKGPEEFDDIKNYRKSIIVDLEDPKTQFSYVVAFIKICGKKFRTSRMDDEEKVRFLAAAFNRGIDRSYDEIESIADEKHFHTGLIKNETWCYSDIALFWYRRNILYAADQWHSLSSKNKTGRTFLPE